MSDFEVPFDLTAEYQRTERERLDKQRAGLEQRIKDGGKDIWLEELMLTQVDIEIETLASDPTGYAEKQRFYGEIDQKIRSDPELRAKEEALQNEAREIMERIDERKRKDGGGQL